MDSSGESPATPQIVTDRPQPVGLEPTTSRSLIAQSVDYRVLPCIIIIMEKTEARLKGLCIREIDVKSQILVT